MIYYKEIVFIFIIFLKLFKAFVLFLKILAHRMVTGFQWGENILYNEHFRKYDEHFRKYDEYFRKYHESFRKK